jgi:hypothetical protein
MEKYKDKITGQQVLAKKLPRILTYPKVFFEVRISDKVEYISLTDFKKKYEKQNTKTKRKL